MKIGVIGTGMVSQAISGKLAELGHQVMVGARSADSESLAAFGDVAGIETGSFADAAAFGELVFSLVGGEHTLEALDAAGAQNLAGKTLIDTSNQLDHSHGFPPRCSASEENCLAVKIQQRFPDTHVVKSLNTMNSGVMINPASVPGDHVVFVSGDDETAKAQAKSLLAEFGWRDVQIVDLGGIASAASVEMLMPLWLNVVIARGGFDAGPFNLAINS